MSELPWPMVEAIPMASVDHLRPSVEVLVPQRQNDSMLESGFGNSFSPEFMTNISLGP